MLNFRKQFFEKNCCKKPKIGVKIGVKNWCKKLGVKNWCKKLGVKIDPHF